MAVINVTVSGQTNPSVEISGQTNPSVTINTIPRGLLSGQIVSNDAEIASLIAATGALSTATETLIGATGELSVATGNLNLALTAPTGALTTSLNNLSGSLTGAFNNDLNNLSGNLTGVFNNDLNNLSGTLTGVTGELVKTSDSGLFYPRDNPSGFVTGSADLDLSSLIPSGGDADIKDLTVTGNSTLSKTLNIFPPQGRAITARATNSNNAAIQVVFEGPTTVGHDFFKQAGFENGFGDNSNHFHDLTDINRIKQAPEGDVKNLERVQERYYAITSNNLPNGNAAFWAWHRTARKISTSNVDTSNATLNVTGLQGSSNRLSDSQKPFRFNTSPVGKSEEIIITLNSHPFSVGDSVKMIFSQSFEGPIVAAGLFGKVSSRTDDNIFGVELYGGNYKTTSEVSLGASQTALNFDFVTLQTVGTDTIVQNGNEVNLQHYSKTNFTPNRLRDNTLKASWSSAHGLKKNETLMIITAADRSTLEVKQGGYVIDPDPDGDGLSAIIVYGRRIDTIDLASFTAFGASNWSIHKGSIDGIHDDTLGDNLWNFNANNVGEYKQYQIGPGCETDADCISIGRNVYNSESGTIKIGYENEMLNIGTVGIDVTGSITSSGIIKSSRLNVGTGKFYVDDDSTNYSVKLGAYGQGTFFGKDGAENGAQYTLAVGTGGKICEDLRVQTFKISGDGFLNLNASPKTLIPTPGPGKAIRVHDVCFYVDHNGDKGVGAGGFDEGSEACYNVGIHSDTTYASNEQFYACAGLPRNLLVSEPGDFIWAGEPDDNFRILPNRALLLKSPAASEITTANTAAKPGGAHYIKIRYQILNLSSDFQNVANLTSITS